MQEESRGSRLHFFQGDDEDDRVQEQRLRALGTRGSPPMRDGYGVGYGLQPGEDAMPLWPPVMPDMEVIVALSEWVMKQSERIRFTVFHYLEDPDHEKLDHIIQALGLHKNSKKKPATLTDLIYRSLPATKDQLYDLARHSHLSRRPEAAARQCLRNLVEQGRVSMQGEQYAKASAIRHGQAGAEVVSATGEASGRKSSRPTTAAS